MGAPRFPRPEFCARYGAGGFDLSYDARARLFSCGPHLHDIPWRKFGRIAARRAIAAPAAPLSQLDCGHTIGADQAGYLIDCNVWVRSVAAGGTHCGDTHSLWLSRSASTSRYSRASVHHPEQRHICGARPPRCAYIPDHVSAQDRCSNDRKSTAAKKEGALAALAERGASDCWCCLGTDGPGRRDCASSCSARTC